MFIIIVADQILFPDEIVFETENFKIAQDWEVPIAGFLIISSKRKVKSIVDLTETEAKEFIVLLQRVRKGLYKKLNIEEVYLFQNEDTDHWFHFWIFPRHKWMDPFGRKIQSVRPIMDYATRVQTIGPIINYARQHRSTEEYCDQVRLFVRVMRDYMNEISTSNH